MFYLELLSTPFFTSLHSLFTYLHSQVVSSDNLFSEQVCPWKTFLFTILSWSFVLFQVKNHHQHFSLTSFCWLRWPRTSVYHTLWTQIPVNFLFLPNLPPLPSSAMFWTLSEITELNFRGPCKWPHPKGFQEAPHNWVKRTQHSLVGMNCFLPHREHGNLKRFSQYVDLSKIYVF